MGAPKPAYIILHKMLYAESNENTVVSLSLFDIRYSLDGAVISALQGIKAIVKRAGVIANPLAFQAKDTDFAVRVVVPQVQNKQQLCEHTMLVYSNRGVHYGEGIELLRKYVKTTVSKNGSEYSLARFLGEISPTTSMTTVVIAVAMDTPPSSPTSLIHNRVAIEAVPMLTILLPTRIVESTSSK